MTGFTWQVLQVAQQYFTYRTTSSVMLVISEVLRWHDVAFCIRYNDILDIKSLTAETSINISHAKHSLKDTLESDVVNESKMKIQYIFDYTPKPHEVIQSCIYRTNDWVIDYASGKGCTVIFNISRFMTQDMMCYLVYMKKPIKLQRKSVTLSTFYPNHVYELLFTEKLSSAVVVNAISTGAGLVPWMSREYSSPLTVKAGNEVNHNFLLVSPLTTLIYKLPAPFDTQCIAVASQDRNEGVKQCLLQQLSPRGLAPTWSILFESEGQLRPFSQVDARMTDVMLNVSQMTQECNRQFALTSCDGTFKITHTHPTMRQDTILGFALMSPKQPDILVQSQSVMSFIEFFSYISSCFGIWFGISFLSLDPFKTFKYRVRCININRQTPGLTLTRYAYFTRRQTVRR